mgnify:CR=1 FL=1
MVETHISAEKIGGREAGRAHAHGNVRAAERVLRRKRKPPRLFEKIPQVVQRRKHIADGGCNGCACRALFQTGDENRVEYNVRNRADHAADHGLLARAFRAHTKLAAATR